MVEKKSAFTVTSTSFQDNQCMDIKYTSYGKNIQPQLQWSDVPEGTKSFSVICEDADAKPVCGFLFVHWILKNIPGDITEIPEGKQIGEGIKNHARTTSYFGPRPAKGTGNHRYYFRVFALDVEKLESKSYDELMKDIAEHQLGEAVICSRYESNK